jgi:threonine-phosphate decarboxylase
LIFFRPANAFIRPRPDLLAISVKRFGKAEHGGRVKHCSERSGREYLDFSANLNPFPPAFSWDPAGAPLDCYPDDGYHLLKERIGDRFGRLPEEIAVGNGSIELIRTFCLAALGAGDCYDIEDPTFCEYALSAEMAGACRTLPGEIPVVRFLCNPNNPTGRLLCREDVASTIPEESDSILFVDEAFIELSDPGQSLADVRDNQLFVVRSLTKSFAVPGIRFGYGFGNPELIATMEAVRPPWSVNAFAERFAIEAFRHYDLLEASRKQIANERLFLEHGLTELSLPFFPSSANFILVQLPIEAVTITRALEHRDILVRDCNSFGLPLSIRIAVRSRDENMSLLEALAECLP